VVHGSIRAMVVGTCHPCLSPNPTLTLTLSGHGWRTRCSPRPHTRPHGWRATPTPARSSARRTRCGSPAGPWAALRPSVVRRLSPTVRPALPAHGPNVATKLQPIAQPSPSDPQAPGVVPLTSMTGTIACGSRLAEQGRVGVGVGLGRGPAPGCAGRSPRGRGGSRCSRRTAAPHAARRPRPTGTPAPGRAGTRGSGAGRLQKRAQRHPRKYHTLLYSG